ncbi:MAG: hypothetical protein F4Y48_08405 [Gammaproteobacteria bacterium]|nr:hypothetical protein [Gammaproteobacteria bacterium]
MTETITITVDPDLADAYRAASDQDRRKLDLLLNLCPREVMWTAESLHDVMTEITRKASDDTMKSVIRPSSWLGPHEVERSQDPVLPKLSRNLDELVAAQAVLPKWMAEPLSRRIAHV